MLHQLSISKPGYINPSSVAVNPFMMKALYGITNTCSKIIDTVDVHGMGNTPTHSGTLRSDFSHFPTAKCKQEMHRRADTDVKG
jgi:hypothetical protein